MLIPDDSHRQPVPPLARRRLSAGIGANLASRLGHGPIAAAGPLPCPSRALFAARSPGRCGVHGVEQCLCAGAEHLGLCT
jgi:hypothetical protein